MLICSIESECKTAASRESSSVIELTPHASLCEGWIRLAVVVYEIEGRSRLGFSRIKFNSDRMLALSADEVFAEILTGNTLGKAPVRSATVIKGGSSSSKVVFPPAALKLFSNA